MGGTLAFINWQTTEAQQTAVTFTVTPNFSCSADAGGHITSNDKMLAPTDFMDPELWNTDSITSSGAMFAVCKNLVGGSGTKYNASYQDKTYARIDNPPDNPGYFTYKAYNN